MRYLAEKTKAAIDAAIEADQGAAYRVWLGKIIGHMDDAYRGSDHPFRSHLGASMLGQKCGRQIWYNFRWTKRPTFSGRILRLFNRGHLEEARFIACLLTMGCEVYQQDDKGKQFKISWAGGHAGGSTDGVVIGLPELPPGTAALCEFKTHADKSFTKLVKEGVKESKPEHYTQMQLYMRKKGLGIGLYGAVNKNNDDLYWELIPLDIEHAEQYLERGEKLVFLRTPPERISTTPAWFECSWCDYKKQCFGKESVERNCRTCASSLTKQDGTWVCQNAVQSPMAETVLDQWAQLDGCKNWSALEGLNP